MIAAMILTMFLPIVVAAAFLLGRHWPRRSVLHDVLSPVTRQHLDLFQGGQLNEAQVEAAKARFRDLLERGELAAIEASIRPGTQFVVQVRALAEIGTDEAGHILERQLQRRLSDDQIEQSWYWIDLANGLRSLNRAQSLPHLLRCADAAGDMPLGHFLAAETVCFLGFTGYLRQPDAPLGKTALRVLHCALEGLRDGVPAQLVPEARLGEMIESLWDHRPEGVHPLVVRVVAETVRLLHRAEHVRASMSEVPADRETLDWQMSRLMVLGPALTEYLDESAGPLAGALGRLKDGDLRDALLALNDLRAEAGAAVMALLARPGCAHAELAVEVLAWSREEGVAPWLRDWMQRQVPMVRRARWRRRPFPPRRPSLPASVPYRAALRALRNHPARETEAFLLAAASDWDPTYRVAAIGSLGWWEPVQHTEVLTCLHHARRDPSANVRQAARAALARLGQRQALQWFRQALTSEDLRQVHEAIQVVASEDLTLLWPDLDRLADAEDPDVAHLSREALMRMGEDFDRRRGK